MPHYYFDIRDGLRRTVDDSGEELPDLTAAVARAHTLAKEIGVKALRQGAPEHVVVMDVRNKWGAVFETVRVRAALH